MAHEIGHLLMPPGHSLKGIMRARLDAEDWKLAEVGCLAFHRREAEHIMREITRSGQPETIRARLPFSYGTPIEPFTAIDSVPFPNTAIRR